MRMMATLWCNCPSKKFRRRSRNRNGAKSSRPPAAPESRRSFDNARPRDAGEIGAGRFRREHDTVFHHEDIGGRQLRDVVRSVAHQAIVEAARTRLDQRPRIIRVEAAGLGLDRSGIAGRAAVRRQRDGCCRSASASARRTASGTSGSIPDRAARSLRRRLARPNTSAGYKVRRRVRSAAVASRTSAEPGFDRNHRLEAHGLGRLVDARAMRLEIGRNALESARAVEHRGPEPCRMRARAHDRHIAVMPAVLEERQRLGPGNGPHRRITANPQRLGVDREAFRRSRRQ